MLSISRTTRVFLATGPTDMRKGFDGLFALVENVIEQDPFSGHLFVFRNRRPGTDRRLVVAEGAMVGSRRAGDLLQAIGERRVSVSHGRFRSPEIDDGRQHRLAAL